MTVRTIVLHGVESVGKSMLAERLAAHFGTGWVPEYGREHAEVHGTDMDQADLLAIGQVQSRWIGEAAARSALVIADTDALMTAAWAEMMLGHVPPALLQYPRADLYLLLEPDVPWIDDGTRIYGTKASRARFAEIARDVLVENGTNWREIGGGWDARFVQAVSAIDLLRPRDS
jgi:HTH-type transcriptional regulator, transcriptional repressor of NAD biosynthesis genes